MPIVEATDSVIDTHGVFTTPEHIAFRYRLAGPMARGLAWLLDTLLRLVILIALGIVLSLLGSALGVGLYLVAWFVVDWFYGALFEWLARGATPGKRALGIRVVGIDGLPAGAGACVVRNLLRAADGMPVIPLGGPIALPTFLVGVICMLVNRDFRRLGDLAAGTLVIYDERAVNRRLPRIADARIDGMVRRLPADTAALVDGPALRAITAYIQSRRRFGPGRRVEVASHLAGPLRRVLGLDERWNDDHLLCAIYVACFQDEAGLGARAAALIRRRAPGWRQLEDQLSERRRSPERFARLYRDVCADLAIAEAYHLPEQQTGFLHDLVARAHLAFYRRIAWSWQRIADVVFFQVPAALHRDGCLRIAMLSFFGVFFLCAYAAAQDPSLVRAFLGDDMVEMFREMYSQAPDDRDFASGGMASGFYILNNVSIALACFASGVFLGVGSLIYLVFNGIVLGLVFGFMASDAVSAEVSGNFFEFVTAHGPFELTGIALSGAAGMRLGLGLVAREGRPFAESMTRAGRRAFPIIAVAAVFVAAAAPIEGFVSPSGVGVTMKRVVGATCLLVVVAYLLVLGPVGSALRQRTPRVAARAEVQGVGA